MYLLTTVECVSQLQLGSIEGRVTEAESKRPLALANILVRGTVIGTSSDVNGSFRIEKILPGTYTVVVSLVGHQARVIQNVEVRSGEVTGLDVQLIPSPIQTEQIVVTASRREQSLQEVPVSIATVTAQMLVDRNIVTIDDALRYVPGVNLLQDQVNVRGSTGYSRGVGSRVLVLLDGLPFLTGDTGEISWEVIPTQQIERIEVVKGAGSALYGSSALGGVINVITRGIGDNREIRYRLFSELYDKPSYREWDWSSKSRFNSGAFLTYADRTGPLGYLFSVGRTVDESYRENDAYHRWTFYSKLVYNISTLQNLTVVGNLLARTHGNFVWWKSASEATRPADSQLNGEITSRRGNIALAYKEFLSDNFFYSVKGIYYGNFWKDDSSGRLNNTSTSNLFHTEIQATYEVSKSSILTFGITGNYDQVNSNIFGDHPGIGGAVYAQEELSVGEPLKLTFGARYDAQRVSALPYAGQLNPKVGLVYNLSSTTTLRASFGTGFRYPAIGELYSGVETSASQVLIIPNPDLKAEKSMTYELGIAHSLSDNIYIDGALFTNDFDNLIEAAVKIKKVRTSPSDTIGIDRAVIQFDNVTRARIQGGELGIKIDWFKKYFITDINYTYTWPLDLSQNTILQFRPRHLFYTSGVFNYEHLRASVDFRYVSQIERIDENLVRLAPIVNGEMRVPIKIVDARASYDLLQFGLRMRIGLNVNNLLNYNYVELIGNLAPIRNYVLTVEGIL